MINIRAMEKDGVVAGTSESGAGLVAAAMPDLLDWIGRARIAEETIDLAAVRRIAATFDRDPDTFVAGSALPPHWFGLFFAEPARHSVIGPDGHPRKGEFLPPIPLPRRMGAGRRVRTPGVLHVGDCATRRVEVAAITPKAGRTGQIVVLTMRHTVSARGVPVAVAEFDAIYREAVADGMASPASPPEQAATDLAWAQAQPLDPVQVFRYGALTWNAHRIHYDADYARRREGYPGVVMNGGLTLHLMLDAALARAGQRLAGFTARLRRPLFVGDVATIGGTPMDTDGRMTCQAADKDGLLAADMTLEFDA